MRIPAWTTGATVSVNGVAAEHHRHARARYATAHPVLGLRRHASPSGCPCRCACEPANDNANVVGGHLRPGRAVRQLRQHARCPALPALTTSLGHPHQHHRRSPSPPPPTARRSTSARSTTRTATTTPSTGAPTARAAAPASPATGWSTRPAASCSASRTCPPPTAAWPLQWADNGTADHNWELVADGTARPAPQRQQRQGARRGEHVHRRQRPRPAVGRQRHRRPPLDARRRGRRHAQAPQREQRQAARHPATAPPPRARRPSRTRDNGTADNRWRVRARRAPGASRTSPAAWCSACRTCPPPTAASSSSGATPAPPTTCGPPSSDTGGYLRLRNSNSGKVLGVENAGTANGARRRPVGRQRHRPTTGGGCGTAANGYFRIQCANGGRVLGVDGAVHRPGRPGRDLGRQRHQRPPLAVRLRAGVRGAVAR